MPADKCPADPLHSHLDPFRPTQQLLPDLGAIQGPFRPRLGESSCHAISSFGKRVPQLL
jgi:hypothetical protein